jgi:hypothetical protein
MASRRKPSSDIPAAATPSQQDESDIVAELGATPAEDESGELQVEEAKLRAAGAADAESIRENRRIEDMVNKKRDGQPGAPFNIENLLEKYEGIIKFWPASTIDILVTRVTGGAPVQWVIKSRPRSGADLYAAIMAQHGRFEEATYTVLLFDSNDKKRRGTGRITMPDTRDTPPQVQPQQQQQGQPMNPYGQPPPVQYQQPAQTVPTTVQVVPAAVDPLATMSKMFELFQQMQISARPAPVVPQPVAAPAPASFPGQSTDPMAMMTQMFEIFQKAQQAAQPPQSTAPSAQPPSTDPLAMMQESFRLFQQMQTPQATPAMPPSPPQGSDPVAMMAWMLQKLQQPQAPAPDPMAMMGKMFEMFERMQRSVQPPASPPVSPPGGYPQRPSMRSGPYYNNGVADGPQEYRDPRYPGPYPQQRPKTVAEEFNNAAGVIDLAMSIADRFRPPVEPEPDRYLDRRTSDDSPVRVVDVGGWPVIVDKKDGSARKWETGVANAGNILKWIAEQREAIMKAAAEREAKEQRQQRPLPEGYVEVTPGYKPPPGYVAVPVDELPPPPRDMPQPISHEEEPPKPRRWGAPTVPGGGG